jgi:hypothetical protein
MNKVLLLTAIAAVFNLTVSAQIKKGSILLGGQIGFNDFKVDYNNAQPDQKNKNTIFNISVGTAIRENKVLGVSITYGHVDYDHNYNGNAFVNSKGDQYGIDIFYRQYKKLAKDLYFFGELGAGYSGSNQTDTDVPGNNKTKYTSSGGGVYLSPGVAYRIYKKLQVELLVPSIAGASYTVDKVTFTANNALNSTQNRFGFNTSLNSSFLYNLNLGFKFVL